MDQLLGSTPVETTIILPITRLTDGVNAIVTASASTNRLLNLSITIDWFMPSQNSWLRREVR